MIRRNARNTTSLARIAFRSSGIGATLMRNYFTWNLPTDNYNIERIEVIRGPGATVWGANAVNGVINIVLSTRDKAAGFQQFMLFVRECFASKPLLTV